MPPRPERVPIPRTTPTPAPRPAVDLKRLLKEFSAASVQRRTFTPSLVTTPVKSPAAAVAAALATRRAVRKVARQEGISTEEAARRLVSTRKEVGKARGTLRGVLKAREGQTLLAHRARQQLRQFGITSQVARLVVQQAVEAPGSGVTELKRKRKKLSGR